MPQPIDMKRFEQLKAAGDLPSPRGVAIAIIRLAQSPDVSVAELARIVSGDKVTELSLANARELLELSDA